MKYNMAGVKFVKYVFAKEICKGLGLSDPMNKA